MVSGAALGMHIDKSISQDGLSVPVFTLFFVVIVVVAGCIMFQTLSWRAGMEGIATTTAHSFAAYVLGAAAAT